MQGKLEGTDGKQLQSVSKGGRHINVYEFGTTFQISRSRFTVPFDGVTNKQMTLFRATNEPNI